MNRYLVIALIFLQTATCFPTLLNACGCEVEGPFLKVAPSTDLVAIVQIEEYLSFQEIDDEEVPMSMSVKILKILKGTEHRERVLVWGNNGMMCRPYLSIFQPNTTWVMAFGEDGSLGHEGATRDDYAVSKCGEHFLKVSNGIVSGAITSDRFQNMTIASLKAHLDIIIRNQQKMDNAKCRFLGELFYNKVDTVGIFEHHAQNNTPQALPLRADATMIADDDYLQFFRYVSGGSVSRQIFIFWQQSGRTFVKQIDNLFEYEPIETSSASFFQVHKDYQKWLKKEVIQLPPPAKKEKSFKKSDKKKDVRRLIHQNVQPTANEAEATLCKKSLQIFIGGEVFLRDYDMRLFDKNYNKNFYKKNRKLLIFNWLEILDTEIQHIRAINEKSYKLFKQYKSLYTMQD